MKLRERRQTEKKLQTGEIKYCSLTKGFDQGEKKDDDSDPDGNEDSSEEDIGEDNSDGQKF